MMRPMTDVVEAGRRHIRAGVGVGVGFGVGHGVGTGPGLDANRLPNLVTTKGSPRA